MVFSVLIWKLGRKFIDKKVWKILNVIGTIAAVAVILKFTVWGREETVRHIFMLAAPRSSEFYREMLIEYSCAMKSHFRKSGNQMSGKWKSSYASLLA